MTSSSLPLPPIWPDGQKLKRWRDPTVVVTQYTDQADYHPALIERILALRTDPRYTKDYDQILGIGSFKIFDVPEWSSPEATLIHNRALAMFKKVIQTEQVHVDMSWSTIYGPGDFFLPHSHPRTLASIVYMLEPGNPSDASSGMFLFADPRMAICCQEQVGYMSSPSAPLLKAGTMIMFPGQAVHCVTPYTGDQPRITMSWNLNRTAVEGEALRKEHQPAAYRAPK